MTHAPTSGASASAASTEAPRCSDVPELERLAARSAERARRGQPNDRIESKRAALAARSREQVAAQRARLPRLEIPEELPVAEHADAIVEALGHSRVLVVAGETGSGKTTQLPKLALRAGLGLRGRIGHTQPRRIAARSVAARIAEETGGELGDRVGFQTRFEQALGGDELIKVMTDGILLAETRSDPDLRAYDCLVIDEAHERSLNVDFLLGYLRRLLQRRDDLTVVVTSATIDVERFADYFSEAIGRPVPTIEVSGRSHPVDLVYVPPEDVSDPQARDELEAGVLEALGRIRALERAGRAPPPWARDVLVFLPGERDIRELGRALERRLDWPGVEVLPLYGRLSEADQRRVFATSSGRRIVLATNVAETSLTVPRIGYVIDSGLARISRYSYRTKYQRLPVEGISRASAAQRAGRCGRLAPGVCYRLYAEEDHAARPAFTEPELLRTNLAAVLLRMAELGLGAPEDFAFLDAPEPRAISDGRRLLFELEALDEHDLLTPIGRDLSRLPLDPRLARMVVAARDRECLAEVLVIVAALSGGDPRERPAGAEGAADASHEAFVDAGSDFATLLTLWRWLETERAARSGSAFRRLCRERHLSWVRIREWQALERQLRRVCTERGWRVNEREAEREQWHRALVPGLLSQLGQKREDGDYLGARGARFNIFPGSGLFRARPPWIMAAEIVETQRVYARLVARIDPRWIEAEAAHLLRASYDAPRFSRRQGRAVVTQRLTLYGLPIVEGRTVALADHDPAGARALFLLDGLARGGLETKGRFLAENQALIASIAELEARGRRRDLLVSEETIAAFYGERIPAHVVDGRSFERWRRQAERADPDVLRLKQDELLAGSPAEDIDAQFPGVLEVGELSLQLAYSFAPGDAADGVTLRVPQVALAQVPSEALDWLVPGFLEEKCVALVRALPKSLRRQLAPAPDRVHAVMPSLLAPERFRAGGLRSALSSALAERFGVDVPLDAWDPSRLEPHLLMRVEVRDEAGAVLGAGRDIAALKARHGVDIERALAGSEAASRHESRGHVRWDFGPLAERLTLSSGVPTFPGLVDEQDSVAVRLHPDAERARRAHGQGVLRLLALAERSTLRRLYKQLEDRTRLELLHAPFGAPTVLQDALARGALRRACPGDARLVRDEAAFADLRAAVGPALAGAHRELGQLALGIFDRAHRLRTGLDALSSPAYRDSLDDLGAWLAALVPADVLEVTPTSWLPELARYLDAGLARIEQLEGNVARDRERIVELQQWQARLEAGAAARDAAPWIECRWLLEEYRVSLFAQRLGTRVPVSPKRLRRAFEALERWVVEAP